MLYINIFNVTQLFWLLHISLLPVVDRNWQIEEATRLSSSSPHALITCFISAMHSHSKPH